MLRKLFYLILSTVLIGNISSCADEEMISGKENVVIPEGVATLRTTVEFKPLTEGLGKNSRAGGTAGDAMKSIEHLTVLVYEDKTDADSKLLYEFMLTEGSAENQYTLTDIDRTDADADIEGDYSAEKKDTIAEKKTPRATFKLSLPFGKYKIYAVANMKDYLSANPTEYETIEKLKNIPLTWNQSSVASNRQMFGFFTASNDVNSEKRPAGFDAPTLIINNESNITLHAWIKRAASKVTVAYDGSNLYENIYIYIHSAQIKDIPTECYLGKDNSPGSDNDLIKNGESINYRGESTEVTSGLRITRGVPYGGQDNASVHSETANALFFYENMQGTSTDKHQYKNYESKDNKPYGSYIEVKGYYVNKTADNASQGEIIYRFMLGKNVTDDFNAERNYHYKLTLKFKNSANDPDWHIEYEPENPEISVPSPMYISYGYNEVLNIPVVVRGAKANTNTTISAEIIQNPWGYPEHKYYGKSNHEGLEDGFLSFQNTKGTVSISESDRNDKWVGSKTDIKSTNTNTDANVYQFIVPVYTRPLILAQSLTGHNPYVSHDRRAKVKFSVVLDGKTYSKVIEVIQVKRLVNPTGVWRSNNNTSPFDVRLMELNEPDANEYGMTNVNFYAPHSDGPWTAHVEEGADWVEIAPTGSGNWGSADVIGGTGTEIRFDYRPKNTNTTDNVRCGVIRVTYHNNTCVHYVFVSQGNGTVNLAGTKWQNRNVLEQNVLVDNPLMEGSMFKFGNPWWGILVENNYREGFGFDISCWGKTFICTHRNASTGEREYHSFEGIGFDSDAGFTKTSTDDRRIFTNSTTIKPGTYAQWKALETLHRRYGVLYGDECNETKATTIDAYSYWQVGHERGMQGMFVWDESQDGNHIFFPIGSTGNGHRKVNDNAYSSTYGEIDKYSHLKYAQRPKEMPEATAIAVPMYYDIWLRKGAVYWYDVMYNPAIDFEGSESNGYGHDINFHSMLLQTYGSNAVGQKDRDGNTSTDACYIRCVEN